MTDSVLSGLSLSNWSSTSASSPVTSFGEDDSTLTLTVASAGAPGLGLPGSGTGVTGLPPVGGLVPPPSLLLPPQADRISAASRALTRAEFLPKREVFWNLMLKVSVFFVKGKGSAHAAARLGEKPGRRSGRAASVRGREERRRRRPRP